MSRTDDAHQALQRRALARAVATEQSDDFVPLHARRNLEEDVRIPVVAVEPADLQKVHGI
jgi:hypothetical protein